MAWCQEGLAPTRYETDEIEVSVGQWRMLPFIPLPVNQREFDWTVRVLNLSEPQRLAVIQWRQEYATKYAQIVRPSVEPLREASETVAKLTSAGIFDRNMLESYRVFVDTQRGLIPQIDELDERYLNEIQAILSEEQLANLLRVRMMRDRARSGNGLLRREVGLARIDLSQVIDQLPLQEAAAQINPILLEYELAITPVWRKYDEGVLDAAWKSQSSIVAARYAPDGTPYEGTEKERLARGLASIDERRACLAEQVSLQKRLIQINKTYLRRLTESLGPQVGAQLRDLIYAGAYSIVGFPDPVDPSPICERIIQSKDLPEDFRVAINEIFLSYRKDYDRIMADMISDTDETYLSIAATHTGESVQSYNERMQFLRKKRFLIEQQLVERLLRIIPPEVLKLFGPELERAKTLVDNARHLYESPPMHADN
jgi:hypothetical protein